MKQDVVEGRWRASSWRPLERVSRTVDDGTVKACSSTAWSRCTARAPMAGIDAQNERMSATQKTDRVVDLAPILSFRLTNIHVSVFLNRRRWLSSKRGGVANASATTKPTAGLVGLKLGVNGKGEEVKVKREVGSPSGYGERWQAMAAARMAGAEPAAVVLGADKKFHAVELTAGMDSSFSAADPKRFVAAVPSSADIADAQKRVKDLKVRLEQLRNGPPSEAASTSEADVGFRHAQDH